MQKTFIISLTFEKKTFDFYSPSGHFVYNEKVAATRQTVLNHLGTSLKNNLYLLGSQKFTTLMNGQLNELFTIFGSEKIGPTEPERTSFIRRYTDLIDKAVPLILTNKLLDKKTIPVINDDFEFAELENGELTIQHKPSITNDNDDFSWMDDIEVVKNPEKINDKTSDDFNFDELDETSNMEEIESTADLYIDDFDFTEPSKPSEDIPMLTDFVTKEEAKTKIKKIGNFDTFDFSEFDEPKEAVRNAPTFLLSNEDYKLYINFKHKSFKASGKDPYRVIALQNLAISLFINYEFLTSKPHPEWLYCGLESDLTKIFEDLTTTFKYSNENDRNTTDSYIDNSLFVAFFNYRNSVHYFKSKKQILIHHK